MYSLTTFEKNISAGMPCVFMMDRQFPSMVYSASIVKRSGKRARVHVPHWRTENGWELPNENNVLEFSWRESKKIWSQVGDGAPRDDCALLFFDREREKKEREMYQSLYEESERCLPENQERHCNET